MEGREKGHHDIKTEHRKKKVPEAFSLAQVSLTILTTKACTVSFLSSILCKYSHKI